MVVSETEPVSVVEVDVFVSAVDVDVVSSVVDVSAVEVEVVDSSLVLVV